MKETPRAAQAFQEYCLLENRTLAKLAASWKLSDGKPAANQRQIEEWSRQHHWMERVKRYDQEIADERRREKEEAVAKMNERHAMIGTSEQAKMMKHIDALIAAKKFGSQAAVQLLKIALDVERLARGASTEQIAVTGKDGEKIAIETSWGNAPLAERE